MDLHVLPPDVASRIAAGEVVERPASVVKELVENAIDARATKIDIECRRGGIDLICVADNGTGIPSSQVEIAFRRYATSKIGSINDLVNVRSLGFRGEALPSIAAVADVEISTCIEGEPLGSYVYLHGGVVAQKESKPRAQGTTIAIRRLFRHFPARLKFLKSESTENSHSALVISQYALAYPLVSFSLLMEDRLALRSPGSGDVRDVVTQLYGTELGKAMVPIDVSLDSLHLTGLIAPASLSRAGHGHQSTFVNQRWVRSPLLQRAIDEAYRGLLPEGRHAIAILNIELPPDRVDVNVHPSKAQVKFADEQSMFRAVREAVRTTLSKTSIASEAQHLSSWGSTSTQSTWAVHESEPQTPAFETGLIPPSTDSASIPPLRILGQIATTYVVAEGPDGMYVIDQHAAHERITYDRLIERREGREPEIQGLLEPLAIELTPAEDAVLGSLREEIATLGFTLEPFGGRSYLLRSIPAVLAGGDAASVLREILLDLSRGNQPHTLEGLAETAACHAAVRAGQTLSPQELRHLLIQLEQCTQPRTCPHGRPTIIRFSLGQLERLFGRRA
ncbi:MAG: DNA mismatch repair endonuclease MutL [Dehalococcoidia bacterium]|nr:DNA mismatch repair endonuclease MutL [Dehalococcoidia bacterium]